MECILFGGRFIYGLWFRTSAGGYWEDGRDFGVRPVVKLESNINLVENGQYNGFKQWNIN